MSATEFKIEELGNKTYSYKDLGCSDWPLETVKPKVCICITLISHQCSKCVSRAGRYVSVVDREKKKCSSI